jgi:signal transduction histidine kinase
MVAEPYHTPDSPTALESPTRLAALAGTALLDSPPEESFDRVTRLAAALLGAPVALVNLVDDRRQFSKSCVVPTGWPPSHGASLDDSFCRWTVELGEPVAIEDTRLDERVASSAFVREMGLIAYLGVPIAIGGQVIGTLCVAGFEPRRWTPQEVGGLRDLAATVVTEIELRRDITVRRQVERLKDEFVSIVAHELRTPLTSIRGSLGLLATGRLGTLSPQGQRMLEIAAENSARLVRLVNDMLDLERLESGAVEPERRRVTADELVSMAVEAVADVAVPAGVQLAAAVEPGVEMWVDPDRIVQVLINLLSNAIKFSPAGALVDVAAEPRGADVIFRVRDRGRGIPADAVGTIFERFRQVDSSDARDKGGTGLGLPISRSIVQQHGGRIWAASQVGAGSTFFFTVQRSGPG